MMPILTSPPSAAAHDSLSGRMPERYRVSTSANRSLLSPRREDHPMESPRAPRWRIPLPDLTGRRAIVTGASDGVGVEIARGLAAVGADVILPVRNRAKGERAAARIRETV